MRDVAAFAGFAKPVAFYRLGQDHGRLALVFKRRFVGGINFARVMAAAQEFANLVIRQMIHQFEQFGIFAEEMFARVAARLNGVFLEIAIHAFLHALEQQTAFVARKQRVPITAPDKFNDVPARAAEKPLKFLDDFSVAADGAVKPLQIAVDDPD